MKKTITLTLLSAMLLSQSAYSQGVKFGARYMKQRMEQRKLEAAKKAAANAAKETKALEAQAGDILDEYEEKVDDRIFRYVYAYDKDKMRSSERIFMKEKTDGKWGSEREITTGTYKYEYDSQGRLSVKTVTYTANDYFTTYRVTVSYGDGITEYERGEWDEYYQKFITTQGWSYYDNGVLASYTDYYDGHIEQSTMFDMNGVNAGYAYQYSKVTFGGELNSPVMTYYEADGWDDATEQYTSWRQTGQETYTYHPTTGKLVEYVFTDEYEDNKKYTYAYDALGRLVAIREYGETDEEDMMPGGDLNGDGVIDENDRPVIATAKAASAEGDEWELEYEETYTYYNDDVYGVGNSWHDVFGMDGPLTRIDVLDEYGERQETIFTRAADGKLTGITFPNQVTDSYYTSTDKATIDDKGQIIKIEEEYSYESGSWEDDPNYNGQDRSEYSYLATDYTWKDGQAVKAYVTDKYEHTVQGEPPYSYELHKTYGYTYGEGKYTQRNYADDGTTVASTITIEEQDAMRKVHYREYNGSYTDDEYLARYVQTEDISFVRPNLAADVEGMTADSTIVISVPGRVVCAYEASNPQFGFISYEDYYSALPEYDNTAYYVNTVSGSTYFTVEHDGGETVCRDIQGRPIYILTDGRLTREYKYYEEDQATGPVVDPDRPQAAMFAVSIPEGQAYDEITYRYDTDGRFVGKTEVSVDEDGTRTEDITLEYVYDETSGITSVEATAKAGITLNGRRIGLADNGEFSVCTIGGQVLAAGVASYTFASPGIYIINAGNVKTKVLVK